MNVLVVSNLYPPHFIGGYELACARVVDQLRLRGHRVPVLTSSYGATPAEIERDARDEVYRVLDISWPLAPDERASGRRRSLFFHPRNLWRTAGMIRRLKPEVLYAWHLRGMGALQVLLVARAAGVPVVLHHMDYWMLMLLQRPDGRPARGASLVSRWISESLRPRMIFMSQRVRQEFLDHGWDVEDGVVIRHGEDPDRILPCESDPARSSPHLWRLVFAGQIILAKGISLVIQALRLLVCEYGRGDFMLDVIGEGPDLEVARSLARDAGVGGYVRFLGKMSHSSLLERLKDYHLLLFPTHEREPGGNIVVEAMMAGCVVLTSNAGGPSELVEDGVTGCTTALDPSELARRIHEVTRDYGLLVELSRNATRYARREHALPRIVDRIEDILHEVARPQPRDRPAGGPLKTGGRRGVGRGAWGKCTGSEDPDSAATRSGR